MNGQLRVRYCVDCLTGQHDLDTSSWRTDFGRLVRRQCKCEDCDCAAMRVLIEEPSFDQRHCSGFALRKKPGRRHVA